MCEGGASPLSGASEEGLGGLGHEQRERAHARVTNQHSLSLSGASAAPDNRQAASDRWPKRTAESQLYYVGGRELARPPPSGAEGGLRLPHLVRSTS